MTSTRPSSVIGRLLIAGRWQDPANKTFESRSPSRSGEVIGVFPLAGARGSEPGRHGCAVGLSRSGGAPAGFAGPNCSTTSPRSSSAKPIASPSSWPASAARSSPSAGRRSSKACT